MEGRVAGPKFFFLLEIVVVFLLGSFPLIISYFIGAAEGMDKIVRALIPNIFLMKYSFVFVFCFFLVGVLGLYFFKRNDFQRRLWGGLFYVVCEVGGGAVGFLRVAAGAMMGIPLVWVAVELETFAIGQASYFFGFGFIALLEAVFLQWSMLWFKSRRQAIEFNF